MPFQFACPQGHLLSADESQQGRRCTCPHCGLQFAIPFLHPSHPAEVHPAAPGMPFGQPGYPALGQGAPPTAGFPPHFGQSPDSPPWAQTGPAMYPQAASVPGHPGFPPAGMAGQRETPAFPFLNEQATATDKKYSLNDLAGEISAPAEDLGGGQSASRILHIPCPKGHILETGDDMLDQDVLCPFCETQFRLKYANSLESRKKVEEELAIRDARSGDFWLKAAIGLAIVVLAGLVGMIVWINTK
ncbi:MAG: hypothetical protein SFX18_02855 [Pirellulales bacterium]|nr:hypothetical protein [Pirellulales bacterium]